MAWIILTIAGLSEIVWAFGLKHSKGFTDPLWSIITILFIILSFFLFAKAMKKIPIGTAYAAFTGIGAAGTAIISMIFLQEEKGLLKVLFLCLLIGGIIGLKVTTNDEADAEIKKQKEG